MDGRFRQTCMDVGSTSQEEKKDTGCNDLWDRPLHYLDRHKVECPTGKFLTRYRVTTSGCSSSRSHGQPNMKIEYNCMAIATPGKAPANEQCFLSYCNAHEDLKKAFCGDGECTTKQHFISCQIHWDNHGKGEFQSGDRSCNPDEYNPCLCGVTPDPTPSPTPSPPTGVWRQGVKCPRGNMGPNFSSASGTLVALRARCAEACEANDRCEYASMYYAGTGTCYLHDSSCGDYENNRHGAYHTYFKKVADTPSPTPSPPTCSGSGTVMPGGDCSPWMGAKCCSDGGHDCVYVNGSEFLCLPCDHADMHTVGFGDADGHCKQNENCAYDAGTSKCNSKPAVSAATPAPVAAAGTPAPVAGGGDCKGKTNLAPGVFIRVNKVKLEEKVKLVDEDADPICECHDLCENKGADAFMHYTKGKKKPKAICKCYTDLAANAQKGKLKIQLGKRTRGKNTGWITDTAKNMMGSRDAADDTKKRQSNKRRRGRRGRRR